MIDRLGNSPAAAWTAILALLALLALPNALGCVTEDSGDRVAAHERNTEPSRTEERFGRPGVYLLNNEVPAEQVQGASPAKEEKKEQEETPAE